MYCVMYKSILEQVYQKSVNNIHDNTLARIFIDRENNYNKHTAENHTPVTAILFE